jgi:hypothetical protein
MSVVSDHLNDLSLNLSQNFIYFPSGRFTLNLGFRVSESKPGNRLTQKAHEPHRGWHGQMSAATNSSSASRVVITREAWK